MKIQELIEIIEKRIPLSIQEDFDNSGIQIGPFDTEVIKPIITLDINEDVIDKAIDIGSNMIISHHPFLFSPIKKINLHEKKSNLIYKCLKNQITLYSIHTPMDIIDGGLNDYFAELLELTNVKGLIKSKTDPVYKVQVFVPETHKDQIVDKIAELGGGWIGNYSDCTFSSRGVGTFKAHEGTNPFIGKINEREYVNEVKIETVITQKKLVPLIQGVEAAHPYEEVAMEAFILDNPERYFYIGRIGTLKQEMTLKDFLNQLKKITSEASIKYSGNLDEKIKTVAVCTGSGTDFIKTVSDTSADIYITGDIGYHDFQFANENNLSLVEVSHFDSESIFPKVFLNLFDFLNLDFIEYSKSFYTTF